MTLKTGVMMLKIQLYNYIKYKCIRKLEYGEIYGEIIVNMFFYCNLFQKVKLSYILD